MFVTEKLAAFVKSARFDALDTRTIVKTEHAIIDTIASLVAGVPTENATLSRRSALSSFGEGTAAAWFSSERLHPLGALFANCAAASSLDVDDGHCRAAGHPGAAIIPAVLAEASKDRRDGRDIITAVAVGYDVALRIAAARLFCDTMSFASGLWTGFGVVAAIGWLHGLPVRQLAHAIAIAGAEAPQNLPQGDCQASSVKGSSPWSTIAALFAADRAAAGLTGSLDLLDRHHAYRVEEITADLGSRWFIRETYLKPYASCRYTHPVIDAVLSLAPHIPNPESIRGIHVELFPEGRKLPNETAPRSLEGAQFSVPFTAALAARRGASAFRPLKPASLEDTAVTTLAEKVTIAYPIEFSGIFPARTPARVKIDVGSKHLKAEIPLPLGDPNHPLDEGALKSKLRDLADGILTPEMCDRLTDGVFRLKSGDSQALLSILDPPVALSPPGKLS